jgi:threonyl-tRNA synthetase
MPVSDKHVEAAEKMAQELLKADIRVEVNKDNKTLGAKIREATLQKIPYMGIIGDKETDNTVSVRSRDGKDLGTLEITQFINQLKEQIEHYQ